MIKEELKIEKLEDGSIRTTFLPAGNIKIEKIQEGFLYQYCKYGMKPSDIIFAYTFEEVEARQKELNIFSTSGWSWFKIITPEISEIKRIYLCDYKGDYGKTSYEVLEKEISSKKEEIVLEETKSTLDVEDSTFGVEYERGVGFRTTSEDNFYPFTVWFKTEEDRDFQLKDWKEKYNEYKKQSDSDDYTPFEEIWNNIFQGSPDYNEI